jgi:hypothetical protein
VTARRQAQAGLESLNPIFIIDIFLPFGQADLLCCGAFAVGKNRLSRLREK